MNLFNLTKYIIMTLLVLSPYGLTMAQTTDSEGTGSARGATPLPDQIEDLKERLATKVAQLNQIQKKAYNGTIKSISIASFSIETIQKELKIELTDDLLVYRVTSQTKSKIKFEDLKQNQNVTIFGDYDSNLDLIKAKLIYAEPDTGKTIYGHVVETDSKNYTVTLKNSDKPDYIVDFEKYTKAYVYNADDKVFDKIGFSDLKSGDFMVSVSTSNDKISDRYSSLRLTLFPEFAVAKNSNNSGDNNSQ